MFHQNWIPATDTARVIIYVDAGNTHIPCENVEAQVNCKPAASQKFVVNIRPNGKVIKKSCEWLGKMKAKKPEKANRVCKR